MDMPLLIADIGRSSEGGIYDKLGKSIKIASKDLKKDLINVFLDLNIDKGCIEFDVQPYYPSCEKDYNYFGNNSASNVQFYPVRDASSILYYWFGKSKGVFKNLLDSLEDGQLKEMLEVCEKLKLFDIDGVNCGKVISRNNETLIVEFAKEGKDKNIYVNKEKSSGEKLFLAYIGAQNAEKICLVIPRIIYNNSKYVISNHKDYLELCEKQIQGQSEGAKSNYICHICNKVCDDVNTVAYSGKLSRSSISKAFVTTTINYAPNFDKNKFDSVFSICGSCASLLKSGENKAMSEMKSKIAGEDAVLLFEGLYENIEYGYCEKLKKNIDIVFNTKDSQEWFDALIAEINEEQKVNHFYFSIIFYKTDGNSCSIKKTIESVSNAKFKYIQKVFEESRLSMSQYLRYFNLGHIYKLVPVSADKKGTQLNIKRVLNLISAVIQGELIYKNEIMEFACEALEKGVMQLKSSELRNYRNLYSLEFFYNEQKKSKDCRYTDKYIKKIVMSYICLFKSLQKLNILNREVFKVVNEAKSTGDLPEEIAEMETFLNSNGFSTEAKGLFYLGAMIYQIGVAQAKKQHAQKPILDKISFSGMNAKEVVQMYLDVLEKTRQYQKTVNLWWFERLQKQMHLNFGDLSTVKLLNEKENVFYIMSGYAFCVDNYKKANIDSEEEKENDSKQ
ncbi:TM1802 family CRISPR-associated protein [Ruminiclostridium josui]|uniref:TM1802 family CRISPR-associated protein n=1 Tax=Ruminiclostridium josui TaxID=1499 RepID=UPI0004679DB8|nr:TM1802 family CRISPR-associated protein [Ruminiclostridium josui]